MTEAERISRFARVEPELARIVVNVALHGGHSLKALRGESKHCELVAARRSVVRQAFEAGFGISEIGRALNRDHSTILHHVKKTGARRRAHEEVQLTFLLGPLFDHVRPGPRPTLTMLEAA